MARLNSPRLRGNTRPIPAHMRHSLLLAGLACAATLALTATTHAAPRSPAASMAPKAFWACTYRDNAPPNWEYVRYIDAPSKAAAEARMRAELPAHQSLVGCNATGG